jgi:hypothetical protein
MSARWNVSQALAWIAYRSMDEVRRYDDEGQYGFSPDEMYPTMRKRPRIEDSPSTALKAHLAQGKIIAKGVLNDEARVTEVKADDWHHLEVRCAPSRAEGFGAHWRTVSFASADVMRVWPATGPRVAEERARAELEQKIRAGEPKMRMADFADHLENAGICPTRRALAEIWRTVTPSTLWGGPGRPKKMTVVNRRTRTK